MGPPDHRQDLEPPFRQAARVKGGGGSWHSSQRAVSRVRTRVLALMARSRGRFWIDFMPQLAACAESLAVGTGERAKTGFSKALGTSNQKDWISVY